LLGICHAELFNGLLPQLYNFGSCAPFWLDIWHAKLNDELLPPPSNFGNVVRFYFVIWMVLPNAASTVNHFAGAHLPVPRMSCLL
jgi:hypothetical protein